MTTAAAAATKSSASRPSYYSVLLHPHPSSAFPGRSPGSAAAAASASASAPRPPPPPRDVVLRARLKVRKDKVCLVLTYDPSRQPPPPPPATPASATKPGQRPSSSVPDSPQQRRTSKPSLSASSPAAASRSFTSTSTSTGKSKHVSPTLKQPKGKCRCAVPPSSSSGSGGSAPDAALHPKQYYVIELQEVSPIAAQLPLSADLRSHLRLNLLDGEAVTYSSHSTPRATALSLGSPATTTTTAAASPPPFASNFYFPPSRAQPVVSQRTRQGSPAAALGAPAAAPTYGQYLSAAEPFRAHHALSLQTSPNMRGGMGSRQPSGTFGEGKEVTLVQESLPSFVSSPSRSPSLMPQREPAAAPNMSLSEKNSGVDDVATPLIVLSPTLRLDSVCDYADLLLVAFFGVPTAAGVPNLSFTTSPAGTVMVEKKPKKLSSRVLPKSLFRWFVPSKPAVPPRRSVSTLSAISGFLSNSTASKRCSPAEPNAPADMPNKRAPAKPGKGTAAAAATASHTTTSGGHRASAAAIPVAAAHVDPNKVLELPFTLNKHDTFYLRFITEDDVLRFLNRYVELQTRLKEARAKRAAEELTSSPLWHPKLRKAGGGRNRFSDDEYDEGEEGRNGGNGDDDVSIRGSDMDEEEGEEGDFAGVDTDSTASYTDYPRNADALGGRDSGDGPLSADPPQLAATRVKRRSPAPQHSDQRSTAVDAMTAAGGGAGGGGGEAVATPTTKAARKVLPPTAFFRSRGWEDYLRHTFDPRFGVPFAKFPLFLWHSFLPLAPLVLYTCHRGFLIVERVPADVMQSEEDLAHGNNNSDSGGAARDTEASKQRLNALVSRLLTPIRTAQTQPPKRPPTSHVNRHGLVEVLPVTPLPLPDDSKRHSGRGGGEDSLTSTGSWDAVKLVLPTAEDAASPHHDDHLTTVKDVFLCLSESHLLFMNSFGHLRFQCSLDEIALLTHSAATEDFTTYPFVRFRLKSGDYFGAPTFVLTFTLLPEVPHEMRAASLERLQRIAAALQQQQRQQQQQEEKQTQRTSKGAASTASSSSSSSSRSSSSSSHRNERSRSATEKSLDMLDKAQKAFLLERHVEFLRVFSSVCPRPLEHHTFSDMIASEMGRSARARISHLTSRANRKVSGSPITPFGARAGHGGGAAAASWMMQSHNTDPILCVKVEATDIALCDAELQGGAEGSGGRRRTSASDSSNPSSRGSSHQRRGRPSRHVSARDRSGELRGRNVGVTLAPQWGLDDAGIMLQDAGRDMDFSLEVATRTMPLLATKAEVHAGYGSDVGSAQHSFHAGDGEHSERGLEGGEGTGNEFVPMAPKKKKSVIVHRTTIH